MFEIEEIESYGMGLSFEPGEASIYAKKNAKFSKLSGKEYDLGNADEDDLEDLADDLYDAIEDAELDDFVNILEYMF